MSMTAPRPWRATTRVALAWALAPLLLGVAGSAGALHGQSVGPQPVAVQGARGWLGLSLREVAVPPGVPGSVNGVRLLVTDLYRGGPAERSGLRPGDVLVRLNGAPAEILRFRSLAARLLPGDPLALTVLRGDRLMDLSLEAGQAPERDELVRQVLQVHLDSARLALAPRLDSVHAYLRSMEVQAGVLASAPRVEVSRIEGDSLRTMVILTRADGSTVRLDEAPGVFGTITLTAAAQEGGKAATGTRLMVRPRPADSTLARLQSAAESEAEWRPLTPYVTGANRVAGAALQPVDARLGAYFGVSRGILVLSLAEGTPARRAGLEAGDVIVKVGGRDVADIADFRTLLARSQGPVPLEVVRRGRVLQLALPR